MSVYMWRLPEVHIMAHIWRTVVPYIYMIYTMAPTWRSRVVISRP